jgi:hypothetical protein
MDERRSPDFETLKARQRAIRDGFPTALALRVHRSISWIQRAETVEDHDLTFICYWIAFNAAYAKEFGEEMFRNEREAFAGFFRTLLEQDQAQRIYGVIWNRFPQSIRVLLDNRYVFQPFWKHHNGDPACADWEVRFRRSRSAAHRALAGQNTQVVLSILFDRLYVLRNQLVHGGATWNSSVNRDQLRDGIGILSALVPIFVDVMMDAPGVDWGEPFYPVAE